MTGVGGRCRNSSSLATMAGFSLARATDSAPRPGIEILKWFSCLDSTRYGPEYGVEKHGWTPPLRMNM